MVCLLFWVSCFSSILFGVTICDALEWDLPKSKRLMAVNAGYTCSSKQCNAPHTPQGSTWNMRCTVQTGEEYICIPFVLDKSLQASKKKKEIFRAMRWFREKTCIAFVYRQDEESYLYITEGDSGCSSDAIGMTGSKVQVELGPGCYNWPTLVFHELMHAIGFEHLHERADRDNYIDINFDNIDPGMLPQFDKSQNVAASNNVTWDYNSVMLYGSVDFQKPQLKACKDPQCFTITKKGGGTIASVYEKQPTVTDLDNINALYQCPQQKPPSQLKVTSSPAAVGGSGVGGKNANESAK